RIETAVVKSTSALTPAAIICRAASSLFRAASKTTGANEAISILSAVCAQRTSSSKLFKPRARKIFAANSRSPRRTPYSRSTELDDLPPRPNGPREFQQNSTIFLRHAAGEKISDPIYFTRQNAKNFRDLIQRRQAQVRRRQFSRLYDCAIGHQRPCRLRSSTLDPENFCAIHFL